MSEELSISMVMVTESIGSNGTTVNIAPFNVDSLRLHDCFNTS